MENQDAGFGEFMSAFGDAPDYQIEGTEEGIQTETGEAAATDGGEEIAAEESGQPSEPQPAQAEESFTLKVNKEERAYSREEVISLAQKGADYDRVKEQLALSRETVARLEKEKAEQQDVHGARELLDELAKDAGVELSELLDNLRMGLLKKQGLSEDAAKERIARIKAEKENATLKAAASATPPAEEDNAQRVRRDLARFREEYPETQLTQELLDKLMPEVAAGKSLLDAYRGHELQAKNARIQELERQLEAQKQNNANRGASPGSQKDSGGRRSKDDYDDFMRAFD